MFNFKIFVLNGLAGPYRKFLGMAVKIFWNFTQPNPGVSYGLATLTPARPDRNGNGPVPAYFFSVLQSGFLAHACSMPACLHQNFEGNLKERLFELKKD